MRNRAKLAVALSVLALSACAGSGSRDRYDYLLRQPVANPSEVVATELAFARAAQEDGQWTAFREYSTDDAVMFVPEPVNAHEWLGKQQNPAQAVKWQPHQVWSSCDGSLAVTKGAWQRPDGSVGYFTTVWERQNNGEYKWVLDQGDALAEPLAAPEFVQTMVADCARDGDQSGLVADAASSLLDDTMPAGGEYFNQSSNDNTLFLNFVVEESQARAWKLMMAKGAELVEVMRGNVAPPAN